MNVFVLCTGRCGSVSFAAAASHITNYSSGHETRARMVGPDRIAYPPNHIEADNRLSWFLGRLDRAYGARARYVHLIRDPQATAGSFVDRWGTGIIRGYHRDILNAPKAEPAAICRDYVETVTANIELFLADKPNRMTFRLEHANEDWPRFWEWAEAEGDFSAALNEWSVCHNPTQKPEPTRRQSWTHIPFLRRHPTREKLPKV